MEHPRHVVPGARKKLGISRGGDVSQFTRAPLSNQPRPLPPGEQAALEARIEQLAYGEILPDDLSEVRRVWWNMARQGIRLPAQAGVLLIHGGAA